MAMAGSLRSPDRFAPATMPVTAGKKTANTEEEAVGEKVEVGGKELEGRSRRDEGEAAGESDWQLCLPEKKLCCPFPGCSGSRGVKCSPRFSLAVSRLHPVKPWRVGSGQLYSCTVVQLYSCTVVQLYTTMA